MHVAADESVYLTRQGFWNAHTYIPASFLNVPICTSHKNYTNNTYKPSCRNWRIVFISSWSSLPSEPGARAKLDMVSLAWVGVFVGGGSCVGEVSCGPLCGRCSRTGSWVCSRVGEICPVWMGSSARDGSSCIEVKSTPPQKKRYKIIIAINNIKKQVGE